MSETNKDKDWDYAPDTWVVVKVPSDPPFYKLVAGWSGSYLYGSTWRVNSGIAKIVEDDEYYYVHGNSGSNYRCFKQSEQVRNSILEPLLALEKQSCVQVKMKEVINDLSK